MSVRLKHFIQYAQLGTAILSGLYLYKTALIACNENYTDASSILFSLVHAIIANTT